MILAALLTEAIQVLDPDADATEAELGQVLQKTAWRQFCILARTGSIKFRSKPVSTCWKAILSGYNILEDTCHKIGLEEAQKWLTTWRQFAGQR